MGKVLLLTGLLLVVIGAVLILVPHLPFLGKLPGDLHFKGKNYSVHVPLATSLLLSVLLTIMLNLFLRR